MTLVGIGTLVALAQFTEEKIELGGRSESEPGANLILKAELGTRKEPGGQAASIQA